MKKYIIKYAVMACLSLGLTGTTASCTDYLDKAPESDVTPENAFKDFHNFQGFVEELYACIPDMAHPLEPGAELAVLGGLGAVHDLAHGHIGEGIHKAGDHHDHAHNTGAHAHHVGIELHQEAGRQDKSKIVGEIAEHIADLVPHPKRGGLLHFICHCILLRWSIQTVQCPFCCIQVCTSIL